MQLLRKACEKVELKVILETGELTPPEIYKASLIALHTGADFIKTSTGKVSVNATLEAAYIMCTALKDFQQKTAEKKGFKAAGGVSTAETAVQYYALVNHILGKEWLTNKFFRIGASSLCNNLLTDLYKIQRENQEVTYF